MAVAGVTAGTSLAATVYFTNSAALSTVQCIGGLVHTGLVLSGDADQATAMADNDGWKLIDRIADYFNLLSLLYVGRDAILVKRALERSGVTFSAAMSGDFEKAQAVTIADLIRLAPDIKDPAEVAREVRQRVMNVALLGLGIYSSSRDASGGYVAAKEILVGKPAPPPPPVNIGTPVQNAAASRVVGSAVQVGLPGPSSVGVPAPKVIDTMLRYKADEVAMISVLLLKKNF